MDKGEVSSCQFFEASEDSSIMFEKSEHDLDFVAFFVEEPVGVALN